MTKTKDPAKTEDDTVADVNDKATDKPKTKSSSSNHDKP